MEPSEEGSSPELPQEADVWGFGSFVGPEATRVGVRSEGRGECSCTCSSGGGGGVGDGIRYTF